MGIQYMKACIGADYEGSIIDKRSTTWYYTFLRGKLVTWRVKRIERSSSIKSWSWILNYNTRYMWVALAEKYLRRLESQQSAYPII